MKSLRTVVLGVGLLVGAGTARAAEPAKPQARPRPTAQAQLAEAQAHMKVLFEGIWKIERIHKAAGGRAVRESCVEERLADARVHVRIGADELGTVQQSLRTEGGLDGKEAADQADRRAYALSRLAMLEQRTREAERAALVCVNDEAGGVDVVVVRVEIAPMTADRELPPMPARAPVRAAAAAQAATTGAPAATLPR